MDTSYLIKIRIFFFAAAPGLNINCWHSKADDYSYYSYHRKFFVSIKTDFFKFL